MHIGVITVDGYDVGTVTFTFGDPSDAPASVGVVPRAMDAPIGGHHAHGAIGHAVSGHRSTRMAHESHQEALKHHGHRHGPGHYPRGEERKGGEVNIKDDVAVGGDRVYGKFAEARDKARQELKDKPWLNEKAIHIIAGENPDPKAATAIWEETINRAAVRGTSVEHEMRRTIEGGYYEGYRAGVSPETRKGIEEARDRALSHSNVSNYATDNSSGGLAARENASGSFTQKSVYN